MGNYGVSVMVNHSPKGICSPGAYVNSRYIKCGDYPGHIAGEWMADIPVLRLIPDEITFTGQFRTTARGKNPVLVLEVVTGRNEVTT